MTKTISGISGETLVVKSAEQAEFPAGLQHIRDYTKLYIARNADGIARFYLAKGNPLAPNEIVVWYADGSFFSGFGNTFREAIGNAMEAFWRAN